MNNKRKLNKVSTISIIAVALVISWLLVAILIGYLTDLDNFAIAKSLTNGLTDYKTWVLWLCLCVSVIVALVARNNISAKRVLSLNEGENARWMTDDDVRRSKNLTLTTYDKLPQTTDGIPLLIKKQGKSLSVLLANRAHTLVIGTTGSGKTSGYVEPVIQVLARTKTKPSLVITDPKGELCDNHSATLKEQGYKVLVFDLMYPYQSARWNPFEGVITKTTLLGEDIEPKNGKYRYNGAVYATHDEAVTAKNVREKILYDEIFDDIRDIIYTVCPVDSKNDPTWQKGARDFILGLALALWEDVRDGICMPNQFNLYTLYKNVVDYAKGDIEEIKNYLNDRDPFSKAKDSATTVTVSTDRTLSSYLSEVNQYMSWLSDSGICAMTSTSDLDFSRFDEEPTALFLRIPDAKANRHSIAMILITQLYKLLVEKANLNKLQDITRWKSEHRENENMPDYKEKLKRTVYVIMDEFGNMPKFPSIQNIITVGRSRGIFMLPIIQDYNQLNNLYGKDIAGIIRSNCNVQVFIGTTDEPTKKEFSEMCGNTKQATVSFSSQNPSSLNVSTGVTSKPLVYPSDLSQLNNPPDNMGNAIVVAYGQHPLKSVFTPVFKSADLYCPAERTSESIAPTRYFAEDEALYRITDRATILACQEVKQATIDAIYQQYLHNPNGDLPKQSPRPNFENISHDYNGDPDDESEYAEDDSNRTKYALSQKLLYRVNKLQQYIPTYYCNQMTSALRRLDFEDFAIMCDNAIRDSAHRPSVQMTWYVKNELYTVRALAMHAATN